MEEKEYNSLNDPFAEAIRSKLANHSMPVDDAMWKGIQQKMAPKRRVLPFWLISSLSAAAGLALLFTVGTKLLQNNNQPESVNLMAEKGIDRNSDIVAEELIAETENAIADNKTATESSTEVQPIRKNEVPVKEEVPVKNDVPVKKEVPAQKEVPVQIASENHENKEIIDASNEVKSLDKEIVKQSQLLVEASNDWTKEVVKRPGVQMAAGIGSGISGTSALFTGGKSYDYLSESMADVANVAVNIRAPNDYSEKEYLPPVTVGLLFRKSFADKLAVESGVMYSYLLTKMSGTSWGDGHAEMHLHYLGIPLNIVTNLMKDPKWEINFSLGGMVEKGLWSVYNQYEDWGVGTHNTEVEEKIDGFQFSAHASIGFSYRIDKKSALFLDPKLSYYFEGDQPFSIRTEMPLQLGVNAGIRFDL